jgi:hypothetical protein
VRARRRFGDIAQRGGRVAGGRKPFEQAGEDQQPDDGRHRSDLHGQGAEERAKDDKQLAPVAVAPGAKQRRADQLGREEGADDDAAQGIRDRVEVARRGDQAQRMVGRQRRFVDRVEIELDILAHGACRRAQQEAADDHRNQGTCPVGG